MVAYLPSGRLLDGGGMVGVFEPQGPFPLAQPQASALPSSPVIFSRTENLDPPITCVASGGPVVGSPRVDDAHPRA